MQIGDVMPSKTQWNFDQIRAKRYLNQFVSETFNSLQTSYVPQYGVNIGLPLKQYLN